MKHFTDLRIEEIIYQIDLEGSTARIWTLVEKNVLNSTYHSAINDNVNKYCYTISCNENGHNNKLELTEDELASHQIKRKKHGYMFSDEEMAARFILSEVSDFKMALEMLRVILCPHK